MSKVVFFTSGDGKAMNGIILVDLIGSTAVFMTAYVTLKTCAANSGYRVFFGARALFCVGNALMARVMRKNRLGWDIALSLIVQLIAITLTAVVVFGERSSVLQIGGLVLGIFAVMMIVWPQGGSS